MIAEWPAVVSSRVERWIAAAVVHSLCSVVERESSQEEEEEEEEEEAAEAEEEADWEEEEEIGCSTRHTESLAVSSRSTAASHDR